MELPLVEPERRTGLHRLWARRKIASLMDGLAAGVPREEVRSRVVEVALHHHLVSKPAVATASPGVKVAVLWRPLPSR